MQPAHGLSLMASPVVEWIEWVTDSYVRLTVSDPSLCALVPPAETTWVRLQIEAPRESHIGRHPHSVVARDDVLGTLTTEIEVSSDDDRLFMDGLRCGQAMACTVLADDFGEEPTAVDALLLACDRLNLPTVNALRTAYPHCPAVIVAQAGCLTDLDLPIAARPGDEIVRVPAGQDCPLAEEFLTRCRSRNGHMLCWFGCDQTQAQRIAAGLHHEAGVPREKLDPFSAPEV